MPFRRKRVAPSYYKYGVRAAAVAEMSVLRTEETDACSLGRMTARVCAKLLTHKSFQCLVRAHGDSEAVAATVLNRRSLVLCQVVFVERVVGYRSANFRTAMVFQLSIPTL